MPQLNNTAQVNASFNGVPMFDTSTAVVDIPSIKLTKTASSSTWHGDELTFTLVVENTDDEYNAVITSFTDPIDIESATLILDSVYLDTTQQLVKDVDFTYDSAGLLTITALTTIDVGDSHTITFRVKKA